MMYPADFSNTCYHHDNSYGSGYSHSQATCDHVPEMVSVAPYDGYCMHSNDGYGYNMFNWPQQVPDASLPLPTQTYCTEHDLHEHHDNHIHPVKKIYDEISAECEHFLLKQNCTECRNRIDSPISTKSYDNGVDVSSNSNSREVSLEANDEDDVAEITKLALSMKRKREQNKLAAARYRERKKSKFHSAKAEIDALEKKQKDLRQLVAQYTTEINHHRKRLGLPSL
uniref:BZIP domain-containing protein n=1 Tax=Panagrellus redivivus TaxID=6233 RepID=A0A7E4UWU6_PANRE